MPKPAHIRDTFKMEKIGRIQENDWLMEKIEIQTKSIHRETVDITTIRFLSIRFSVKFHTTCRVIYEFDTHPN